MPPDGSPRPAGPVVLDLQGAQTPGYRDRGVARYALDFARAVVSRHGDLVNRVLLNYRLPPIGGLDALIARGKLSARAEWDGEGGLYHVLSPFELDVPVETLWPRLASTRRMRLVVTVYDLIPDIFPDIYLADPGLRRRYRARRELIRAADHVFALSESGAADVIERLGIDDAKVSVVGAACGAGFSRPAFRADAIAAARTAVAGLGEHFVVYNGAVEPRKNMEALVEAYAELPERIRAHWQLVLVCRLNPDQRHHYEVLSRRLGIEGRLLLTGFVPDETLVWLYQGCDLMVYPSRYEGYGLPVAEALACGALVIASDNSALRELVEDEARFDPSSIAGMAAAVERGLTDEAFRSRLAAAAARPQPTWDDVADRAAEVYSRLLRVGGGRQMPGWRRRPLIALVSPMPPSATGVAVYSARLVDALLADVDVDVFADGDDVPEPADGTRALSAGDLPAVERIRGGYDAVIYCLGNSEFHAGALAMLRQRPGVVLAHEVRLTGLYRHGDARGAVPEGFAAALHAMYPAMPSSVGSDGWIPPSEALQSGILMAREVIGLSQRFLTTSEFAAGLARIDACPEHVQRIDTLPFAYPPIVPRPAGEGGEDHLICSFGVVNDSKQPAIMVEAMALLAAGWPAARLVFVGPAAAVERERLLAMATDRGLEGRVEITGWVSDDTYEKWLARATVALQLRAFSNGETSASVGDSLRNGVATVVTDLGSAAELPADCVARVAPDADAAEVARTIAALLVDPAERQRMGGAAQAYVAGQGFGPSARRLLGLIGLIGSAPDGGGPSARAKPARRRYASPGPAGPPR